MNVYLPVRRAACALAVLLAFPAGAQEPTAPSPPGQPAAQDTINAPLRGSELLIPTISFVLPGFGQYRHRAPAAGLAYTGTAVVGVLVATVGDHTVAALGDELPRRGRDQLADQAFHTAMTAGGLSAWDAFHRSVPAHKARGRYTYLPPRESLGQLLSAPFDPQFLSRWTTWVDIAQTGLVTVLVVADRRGKEGARVPFRANDAAYTTSLSMNAAVGEEAMFRGWLLPVFYQKTGERFWLANGLQGAVFGALHLPDADWYAAVIGAWGAWTGWVTKRNDWSIRESIFNHFWYDVAIVAAVLATERRDAQVTLSFPSIRF